MATLTNRRADADHARFVVGLLEHDHARRAEIIAEARDYIASDPRGRRPNAVALVATARVLIELGQAIEAQLGGFVEKRANIGRRPSRRGGRAAGPGATRRE